MRTTEEIENEVKERQLFFAQVFGVASVGFLLINIFYFLATGRKTGEGFDPFGWITFGLSLACLIVTLLLGAKQSIWRNVVKSIKNDLELSRKELEENRLDRWFRRQTVKSRLLIFFGIFAVLFGLYMVLIRLGWPEVAGVDLACELALVVSWIVLHYRLNYFSKRGMS